MNILTRFSGSTVLQYPGVLELVLKSFPMTVVPLSTFLEYQLVEEEKPATPSNFTFLSPAASICSLYNPYCASATYSKRISPSHASISAFTNAAWEGSLATFCIAERFAKLQSIPYSESSPLTLSIVLEFGSTTSRTDVLRGSSTFPARSVLPSSSTDA